MRHRTAFAVLLTASWIAMAPAYGATEESQDPWAAFLDYAYIYSSSEPVALEARLRRYAGRGGVTLIDYIAEQFEAREARGVELTEAEKRRKAVGYFLDYIATGRVESLEASLAAMRELEDRLERRENRYWHHYLRAHRALEQGKSRNFVREVLALWLEVVVELETPYDTYRVLHLNRSTNVGFVGALLYLYENIARLILIRAPQMEVHTGLDPLAGIVRALADGRVGMDTAVIPKEVSSREYLDAIVTRLDGPESDGQSLSFTLAIFEAGKYHHQARELLASEGLTEKTFEATRVAIGAYGLALDIADTLQGECAVYTRVLRQKGELYAAGQRTGADPEVGIPFSIDRAVEIYGQLHADLGDWEKHGYHNNGRQAYLEGMKGLWEEIQEGSFNAADYYLGLGISEGMAGDGAIGNATSHYARYLSFFERYSTQKNTEGVPDSAYFAAHRASRGIADALLSAGAGNPKTSQVALASRHYLRALALNPFDHELWSTFALTLERQGREAEFLRLTKSVAETVSRSRSVDRWITGKAANATQLDALRRALSHELAILYMGFADASGVEELTANLSDLKVRRAESQIELALLEEQRAGLAESRGRILAAKADAADLPAVSGPPPGMESDTGISAAAATREIALVNARIADLAEAEEMLADQVEARSSALPLFTKVLDTAGLSWELGSQRHHPVHSVIRRMYFERERSSL